MSDLINREPMFGKNWKYLINLCGMDFPIGTNLELVRRLKSIQPKNMIISKTLQNASKLNYEFKIIIENFPQIFFHIFFNF